MRLLNRSYNGIQKSNYGGLNELERIRQIYRCHGFGAVSLDGSFFGCLWSRSAGRKVRDLLMSNIRIIHGDCMEAMKAMPDKAYELAIVDPPYGIGNFSMDKVITKINSKKVIPRERNTQYSTNYSWNNKIPNEDYFNELNRVSKEQIIWGANYYNCFSQKGGAVVWYKEQYHPNLSDCEIASLSFQKKVDYVHIQILKGFICKETSIHPCQKPVALYQWLLKNYAKQGDKILDTHGGSCSLAIACDIMGFDADIWEIDEDYYKAAVERFERHKQQTVLEFST